MVFLYFQDKSKSFRNCKLKAKKYLHLVCKGALTKDMCFFSLLAFFAIKYYCSLRPAYYTPPIAKNLIFKFSFRKLNQNETGRKLIYALNSSMAARREQTKFVL